MLAISHWLAFGNPTLLRLGNSNKFDYSRLNRSVGWLTQDREFNEVKEFREINEKNTNLTNLLKLLNFTTVGKADTAKKPIANG